MQLNCFLFCFFLIIITMQCFYFLKNFLLIVLLFSILRPAYCSKRLQIFKRCNNQSILNHKSIFFYIYCFFLCLYQLYIKLLCHPSHLFKSEMSDKQISATWTLTAQSDVLFGSLISWFSLSGGFGAVSLHAADYHLPVLEELQQSQFS